MIYIKHDLYIYINEESKHTGRKRKGKAEVLEQLFLGPAGLEAVRYMNGWRGQRSLWTELYYGFLWESPFGHKSDVRQCSFHWRPLLVVLCILWTVQTPPLPREFPDHIPGSASLLTGRKGCLLSEVGEKKAIMTLRSLNHPAGGM